MILNKLESYAFTYHPSVSLDTFDPPKPTCTPHSCAFIVTHVVGVEQVGIDESACACNGVVDDRDVGAFGQLMTDQ